MNKFCSNCGEEKPLSDFSTVRRNKDGKHFQCKPCQNSYMRKFYANNQQSVKARVRKYHEANREIANKKRQERYLANRPEHLAKCREWVQNNRDKSRASKRNTAHRRRVIIGSSTYQVRAKEIQKLLTQNCFYCGSTEKITIDHVVPIFRGGQHKIGNLVPACKSCNSSKGSKLFTEWKAFQSKKKEVRPF